MNRDDHLRWAKQRALLEHPDLAGHLGLDLAMQLAMAGHLNTDKQVREYVDGLW